MFSNKRKRIQPRNSLQNPAVQIYWDRIYRYVENYTQLFGENLHVSKGELGCIYLEDINDYKIVPFSHSGETGALFEMQEIEEDILSIFPKEYQPGTGIVAVLDKGLVEITRIFYNPREINSALLKIIKHLESMEAIPLVQINFSDYLAHKIDNIELINPAKIKKMYFFKNQ